jgi:hypothetical protein
MESHDKSRSSSLATINRVWGEVNHAATNSRAHAAAGSRWRTVAPSARVDVFLKLDETSSGAQEAGNS